MKFKITVLEHRNHTVIVEAGDEDEAIEAVQQRICLKPDLSTAHGLDSLGVVSSDTAFIEATEVEEAK